MELTLEAVAAAVSWLAAQDTIECGDGLPLPFDLREAEEVAFSQGGSSFTVFSAKRGVKYSFGSRGRLYGCDEAAAYSADEVLVTS